LFLFIKTIYWLCYFGILFGKNSIAFSSPEPIGYFKNLAFLVYNSGSCFLSMGFIIAAAVLSLLNLFQKTIYFIQDFLLWFIVINLNNKIYPTLTGGDYLLNQFLFFNCFLSASFVVNSKWQNALRICLHNFAVIALIIQVCLVYFLSSLAKLNDHGWLSGEAIIRISQIKHFSVYSFLEYNPGYNPVFIFLNYIVLAYQLLFPLLIWVKKIKKPLLILGILMHLYIALIMGLVEFGAIMILAYVLFWPVKQPES
jgi:hypothetical protein